MMRCGQAVEFGAVLCFVSLTTIEGIVSHASD